MINFKRTLNYLLILSVLPLTFFLFLFSPNHLQADEVEYPIVFTNATDLPKLGIVLEGFGKNANLVKPFRNKCYSYGDGGYSLSVSDQFLSNYKARGFSLNSLCMALVSGIRFNPETGQPLPTYIATDLEELKKQRENSEPGIVSDILPLQVPDCFSRGLPYSDCKMKFDPMNGEQLCEQTSRYLTKVGNFIEEKIERVIKSGKFIKECSCKEAELDQKQICRLEKHCGEYISGYLAKELEPYELDPIPTTGAYDPNPHISFIDISPSFPRGFGYALFAEGGAGPSASLDSVKLSLDGKNRATEQKIKAVSKQLQQK